MIWNSLWVRTHTS